MRPVPPPRSTRGAASTALGGLCAALGLVLAPACAPKPLPVASPAPLPPLERACQDLLPLPAASPPAPVTVGALLRALRRANPLLAVKLEPCHAGIEWPIAYASGEPDQPPVGFTVLRMEGDALLTFDEKDREAPAVNLCEILDVELTPHHRVRAVALWPSSDEKAFDPASPEGSTATVAWYTLLSRNPSACALGQREAPGAVPDAELGDVLRCGSLPYVLVDRPGCDALPSTEPTAPALATDELTRRFDALHRHVGPGRTGGVQENLTMEGPERCGYEPPPAVRDTCVAAYRDAEGRRWYGRSEVTRTGANGEKNYVDSYLTFQLLKRLEAERRKGAPPAHREPAAPAAPPAAAAPGGAPATDAGTPGAKK